ncbi:hypothetical protein CWE14_03625 [Aliidiomarina soli]|uniref:Uncharacterized protein n=2 Tax=Aliidiomarina soli TaxID=1928574 RepID=A0A432WN28_9GAMM|nr:hypothetical protein CWE14_03625 [Aliidiomarina soli]
MFLGGIVLSFHKKDCLERVKSLMSNDDEASFRYACLELRQCIESIAYAKLKNYKKVVPESQFSEWHPKRVFDFLLEMEPKADKDYHLNIYEEDENGNPKKLVFSGDHKTISLQYIKKNYNKIGYYLHTPTLNKQAEYHEASTKLKRYLDKLVKELEPIIDCTFDSRMGIAAHFNCHDCGQSVYHNLETIKIGKNIRCLNEQCGKIYYVENYIDEKPLVKPIQMKITCDCGNDIYVDQHKVKENTYIDCECGDRYLIDKRWVYRKET